jgi:Holliday junction resolvasome RuvABC ATP-dependent DNA helicase subunit
MSDTKQTIDKLFPKIFEGIIGQEAAKKKVRFYLNSSLHTRIFPNAIFTAGKGQGKTTLARETAKGLVQFDEDGKLIMQPSKADPKVMVPKRKKFCEVNCSTIKNVKQFINSIIIPNVQDKDVTVFFDEASEIPKDVSMALLTILNPNSENRNTFAFEEYVCDFDFRRQTFLFATSEPQRVFHALIDRLERIDLEDYTPQDLARIVKRDAKGVEFDDAALTDISTVLRGNARAATMMAVKIQQFLRGKTKFNSKNWKELRDTLGILPLGLNATELAILRHLAGTTEGTSLTCLAAKTGLSRDSLQKDYEMYLQRHGLMDITTGGREITAKGLEYLKALDGKPFVGNTKDLDKEEKPIEFRSSRVAQ